MAEKTVKVYGAIKLPKKMTKKEFERAQKRLTDNKKKKKQGKD